MSTKAKSILVVLASVLLVSTSAAKSKEKTYSNSPAQVFAAVVKVAKEHYVIVNLDEKQMILTFKPGSGWQAHAFECTASVEVVDNRSKLIINVAKVSDQVAATWGAGGKLADKFFSYVEDNLKTAK
jgi:hypothetical protein